MVNKKDAENTSNRMFVDGNLDNTNANAFKHAYWSKLNTMTFGSTNAEIIGNAHEFGSPDPNATTMDLHNNKLGRNAEGILPGLPYPDRPIRLYYQMNILNSIKFGEGLRLKDGKYGGTLIPTNGDGRK